MIETPEQVVLRNKKELDSRNQRAEKYALDMGVTLHTDAVGTEGCKASVVTLQPAQTDLTVQADKKLRNRAAYMRHYRKKPKKCPHCGKDITKSKPSK